MFVPDWQYRKGLWLGTNKKRQPNGSENNQPRREETKDWEREKENKKGERKKESTALVFQIFPPKSWMH